MKRASTPPAGSHELKQRSRALMTAPPTAAIFWGGPHAPQASRALSVQLAAPCSPATSGLGRSVRPATGPLCHCAAIKRKNDLRICPRIDGAPSVHGTGTPNVGPRGRKRVRFFRHAGGKNAANATCGFSRSRQPEMRGQFGRPLTGAAPPPARRVRNRGLQQPWNNPSDTPQSPVLKDRAGNPGHVCEPRARDIDWGLLDALQRGASETPNGRMVSNGGKR